MVCFVITGMDDKNSPFISLDKALQDDKRIEYHRDYLSNLSAAIRYKSFPSFTQFLIVLNSSE